MVESTGKLAVGLVMLVVLWIGVYWLYDPRPAPVTDEEGRRAVSVEGVFVPPAPRPRTPEPVVGEASSGASAPMTIAQGRTEPPIVLGGSGASPAPFAGPKAGEASLGVDVKVIPPEMIKYAVQPGDTLAAISMKFYGTEEFASSVAKANPFASPDRLKEGRVINIPRDPNNVHGMPAPEGMKYDASLGVMTVPMAAKEEKAPTPVAKTAPRGPDADPPREYVVQAGDTLQRISKKVYGDGRHAQRIFEANRGKLADPDSVREGQTLAIPPRDKLGG